MTINSEWEASLPTEPFWNVVDKDGHMVIHGMLRQSNAQGEADLLNAEGLPEGRPYRVERA